MRLGELLCCSVRILHNIGLAGILLAMCAEVHIVSMFENEVRTKILGPRSDDLMTILYEGLYEALCLVK